MSSRAIAASGCDAKTPCTDQHLAVPGHAGGRRRRPPDVSRYCTAGEHAIAQAENVPCTCWPSLVLFVQLLPEDARSVEVARLESLDTVIAVAGNKGPGYPRSMPSSQSSSISRLSASSRTARRSTSSPPRHYPFQTRKDTPHSRHHHATQPTMAAAGNQRRSPPRRLERHTTKQHAFADSGILVIRQTRTTENGQVRRNMCSARCVVPQPPPRPLS